MSNTDGTTDTQKPQTPQDPDDKDGLSAGTVAWIVICTASVLGGCFCLYWFALKKKLVAVDPVKTESAESDSDNEEKTE